MTTLVPFPDFRQVYDHFDQPITALDCGSLCAPYNPHGIPFCCDICVAVPATYHTEWDYLKTRTNLWHSYRGDECPGELTNPGTLEQETPSHMCLLACLGPQACERPYRSISCRQFPFFPYITVDDCFIGLAYNWDFEHACWVLSHLDQVSQVFRQEFIQTYDALLFDIPQDYDSYYDLSEEMRDAFSKMGRKIPILHRDGNDYLLDPETDALTQVDARDLPRFGPYRSEMAPPTGAE
ncbi:MAG TPA: hypothetical protein PKK90_06410 [Anaerolineaceae bacterium]|nr:hypothetical protein [Anaerolineaceae bacterium]